MLLGNWKQNWSELHSRLQLTLCVIYIHIVLFFLFVNIGAVTNLLVIPKLESSKVDRKILLWRSLHLRKCPDHLMKHKQFYSPLF